MSCFFALELLGPPQDCCSIPETPSSATGPTLSPPIPDRRSFSSSPAVPLPCLNPRRAGHASPAIAGSGHIPPPPALIGNKTDRRTSQPQVLAAATIDRVFLLRLRPRPAASGPWTCLAYLRFCWHDGVANEGEENRARSDCRRRQHRSAGMWDAVRGWWPQRWVVVQTSGSCEPNEKPSTRHARLVFLIQ
jgi:hypothetical protein